MKKNFLFAVAIGLVVLATMLIPETATAYGKIPALKALPPDVQTEVENIILLIFAGLGIPAPF